MGVYIKGMEMPSCNDCPLAGDFKCNLMPSIPALCKEYDIAVQNGKRLNNCPLIEIPPHGRLIDADTLTVRHGWLDNFDNTHTHIQFVYANEINYTPTVIEAEEGREMIPWLYADLDTIIDCYSEPPKEEEDD